MSENKKSKKEKLLYQSAVVPAEGLRWPPVSPLVACTALVRNCWALGDICDVTLPRRWRAAPLAGRGTVLGCRGASCRSGSPWIWSVSELMGP